MKIKSNEGLFNRKLRQTLKRRANVKVHDISKSSLFDIRSCYFGMHRIRLERDYPAASRE